MRVGHVKEIWKYPVKSLGGDTVELAHIHDSGVGGDRGWALFDANTGDIVSAKQIPKLLNLRAEYTSAPANTPVYGAEVSPVAVTFPNGERVEGKDNLETAISDFVGRDLELKALQPPDNLDHYRMSSPPSEEEFMRAMNIKADEEFPDFADYEQSMMEVLMEYSCPPGNYYDVFPLHLLTTSALTHMGGEFGEVFDARRFRPSMVVETEPGISGIAEFDWIGKSLRIGEVALKVESRTIRCSMPSREQQHYGIEQNPKISKAIYTHTNRYLGVNLTVTKGGEISAGADIELVDL